MKILVAGFQHETNTFAPSRATYGEFVKGEGWPAIKRGAEVLSLRHANVPIAGFLAAMEPAGHALVTVLWAAANPSGPVTEDAFERIAGEIVEASRRHDPDAIYLDLHGAMVTEHYDDGEGELLARLRTATRDGTPIVASLDLHANVTARMQACADGLVAYRTYPHVDMAATGRRAAQLLHDLVAAQSPVAKASRRLPFLIPINGMCTTVEPARGFYARLGEAERGGVLSLSFAPGFPAADFPECGPTVWGYGLDADALNRAVDALYRDLLDSEPRWGTTFLSPDEAVREAIRMAGAAPKPVVIADTQDNPGAGGDGNTTGMLASLVRHNAQQAAIGLLHDPQAARAARCRARRLHPPDARRRLGRPLRRNVHRGKPVGRAVHPRRPDDARRTARARAIRVPADRRRARCGVHRTRPDDGSQPVPHGRHRAGADADPGEQVVRALPRRLRADRAGGAGGQGARHRARGPRRAALDPAGAGHAAAAAGRVERTGQ